MDNSLTWIAFLTKTISRILMLMKMVFCFTKNGRNKLTNKPIPKFKLKSKYTLTNHDLKMLVNLLSLNHLCTNKSKD